MSAKQSALITFEGGDGSGKSTQCRLIHQDLLDAGYTVHLFREPGGTPISEQIRDILLDTANTAMSPVTEMLLYFASRNQLLNERIQPALAAGEIVILDRFVESTLAYQGYGRGLDLKQIEQVRDVAIGALHPDLTILVDTPLETAEERLDQGRRDRLDAEKASFKARVREGYLKLAASDPAHWFTVDGREEIPVLRQKIWQRVLSLLRESP